MLVEICTPGGHLCSVTADCHSHIADIKNQIETATGIPWWEQRLISGQDQLRDSDFLNSIGKGTSNLLLLRRDSEQAHWLKTFTEDSEKHCPSFTHSTSCSSLRDAPETIRSNREVVAAAVRSLGRDLVYASQELRGDKGLALLAIASSDVYENVGQTDDGMFMHLSDELRADREVVAAALQRDATSEHAACGGRGTALQRASETLRNDKDFVLEAVRRFGIAIYDVPKNLREDSDVILTTLRHHPSMELGCTHWGGCTHLDRDYSIECPPQLRRQKEFVLKAAHLGQFNFVLCSSHDQWHDSADQNWANDQDFIQELAPLLYPLCWSRYEPIIGFEEMGTMLGMLLGRWYARARHAPQMLDERIMRSLDPEEVIGEQTYGQYWNDVVYNRKQILEEARSRKWFRDSARQSRAELKKQRTLKSQAVGQRGGRHKVPDIDFWDL